MSRFSLKQDDHIFCSYSPSLDKKPNLSQSVEVPKVGCWMNFEKKFIHGKGGGEGCEVYWRITFFCFSCVGQLSCTLKWSDLFLKLFWFPVQKWGLENQLPSLVDHFDRYFFHTTGEGLQLWFWSLSQLFLTVRSHILCYVWCSWKKIPCGA